MAQNLRGGSPRVRQKQSRRQGEGQVQCREALCGANSRGFKPKPNPKARGDEQEPDMRCGMLRTSWHVTTKSSICEKVCFINPAFTARKRLRIFLDSTTRRSARSSSKAWLIQAPRPDPPRCGYNRLPFHLPTPGGIEFFPGRDTVIAKGVGLTDDYPDGHCGIRTKEGMDEHS